MEGANVFIVGVGDRDARKEEGNVGWICWVDDVDDSFFEGVHCWLRLVLVYGWFTTVLSCVSVQDVARESLASGITNQPMTTEKDNNVA